MVVHTYNPITWEEKQEDLELKANLGYKVSPGKPELQETLLQHAHTLKKKKIKCILLNIYWFVHFPTPKCFKAVM